MKGVILIICLLGFSLCHAHRQWEKHDLTEYAVGGDTVITVMRHTISMLTNGESKEIKDFYSQDLPDYYIRDFDFRDARHWYLLIGSRYYGYETYLYETTDAGESWKRLDSYIPVSISNSINQMQIEGGSTIYLFDNYYDSAVIRSDDGGKTWHRWFRSMIAHYFGIFACGESRYVYGMSGDGFRPYMRRIPDSLFGRTNEYFFNECHNNNPECTYADPNQPFIDSYNDFKAAIDGICVNSSVIENRTDDITLYPVPSSSFLFISGLEGMRFFSIDIHDLTGCSILHSENSDRIDVSSLGKGAYQLALRSNGKMIRKKFVKE